MLDDMRGYNSGNIVVLRDNIQTTLAGASEIILEELDRVVSDVGAGWYAPEAVTFFEGFATTVANSAEPIRAAFDSFRDGVQKAGQNWAENTGGEAPELAAITKEDLTLNVSAIQEKNANGDIYLDESAINSVINELPTVQENIKSRIGALAADLEASAAFLGGNQAASIATCFQEVGVAVSNIFKYLTEGDDSLSGQFTKAIQKYSDVASNISDAFSNASTGTSV